jgi:hypothetical protein
MTEQDYLKRRIAEEYAAAGRSFDERAVAAHLAMASAYARRLGQTERIAA